MVYRWPDIPAARVPYLRIPSDARWSFQSDAGSRSMTTRVGTIEEHLLAVPMGPGTSLGDGAVEAGLLRDSLTTLLARREHVGSVRRDPPAERVELLGQP